MCSRVTSYCLLSLLTWRVVLARSLAELQLTGARRPTFDPQRSQPPPDHLYVRTTVITRRTSALSPERTDHSLTSLSLVNVVPRRISTTFNLLQSFTGPVKMPDQVAWHEVTDRRNPGRESARHENAGPENDDGPNCRTIS